MTDGRSGRAALALVWLAAAVAVVLVDAAAVAAVPAATSIVVMWAGLRCYKPADRPRIGWLLIGLSAGVAGVAAVLPAPARPWLAAAAALLLAAGTGQIQHALGRSALAAPLSVRWRVAAACAGLVVLAPVALAAGWPEVVRIAGRAAAAFAAAGLLRFAVQVGGVGVGRPLVWLVGATLVLALDAAPADALAVRGVSLAELVTWIGWPLAGLAAAALLDLRHAAFVRLTAAREAAVLRKP